MTRRYDATKKHSKRKNLMDMKVPITFQDLKKPMVIFQWDEVYPNYIFIEDFEDVGEVLTWY